MSSFTVRQSIEAMEEYAVESVAADIIVNANESNYPLPQEIAEKITQRTARFPFNRYPPIKSENLCEVIAKELDVDIDCVKIGNGSSGAVGKGLLCFWRAGQKDCRTLAVIFHVRRVRCPFRQRGGALSTDCGRLC